MLRTSEVWLRARACVQLFLNLETVVPEEWMILWRAYLAEDFTIQEAARLGLYDQDPRWRCAGPNGRMIPVWCCAGPRRMLPVGSLPFRTGRNLRTWTFSEWRRYGEMAGIEIRPLKDPLYYTIQSAELMRFRGLLCSRNGNRKSAKRCRKIARYWSVPVIDPVWRATDIFAVQRRMKVLTTVCCDCVRALGKRGLLITPIHQLEAVTDAQRALVYAHRPPWY